MEEKENENSHKKLNPVSMKLLISSHAADPLISSIATLFILILLYFPHLIFLKIILSPVLIITVTLLLALLRFGATQRNQNTADQSNRTTESDQDHKWVTCKDSIFATNPCFEDSFVEWNVRAPLEVIYEAYEGEGGGGGEEENVKDPSNKDPFLNERYASLSLYYPETDSDTSSDGGDFLAVGDWESPESACFRWEDEENREGLIEIALDNNNKREGLDFENFHGEEEENNLIEIDISPVKDEEK